MIEHVNASIADRLVLEEMRKRKETEALVALMEEMANAPKEGLGKRQPGEKGAYELERSRKPVEKI